MTVQTRLTGISPMPIAIASGKPLIFSKKMGVNPLVRQRRGASEVRCAAAPRMPALDAPQSPPVASWLGLGFILNGSDFTRQSLQKHGHVWKAYILGNAIYGLGGVDGLKAFYDEDNVKRFPGMSPNLVQAAWQLVDAGGNPHYAIPPLDSDRMWKERKLAFMAGINSRASAQKYIDVLSGDFDAELAKLGADGSNFSLWDAINRLVLGGLSKTLFGFGMADYKHGTGQAEVISNIHTNYKVFNALKNADDKQKAAFQANVAYLRTALAEFRANPGKYPDAGLTTYLPEAKKLGLADEDILMDMHQMVCVGAYGGVTSASGCLAYSLAKYPAVRKKVKAEMTAANFSGTPTFETMKKLPYTFATLKESLRYWPIVHIVRGQAAKDIVVEGKMVPSGSTVIGMLHGTMHDPTVFKNPDRFEPERFLEPRNEGSDEVWAGYQVVFGAGNSGEQHACAGRNISLLLMFSLLISMVKAWEWEWVTSDEKLVTNHFSPDPSKGLTMRRL